MATIIQVIMTRAAHHFYGKFPQHPICTGVDVYPVVAKTNAHKIADLEYVDNYLHDHFTYKTDVWERTDKATDKWNFMSTQGLTSGDCEDFAITAIQMLLEEGWTIDDLKIEIGFKQGDDGSLDGHAWLVATVGGTEYVLDSGTGIKTRTELKTTWGLYGWKQIEGAKWGLVLNNTLWTVSTDPFYQFDIEPVPYTQVKRQVLTMTGTLEQKV